MLNLFKTDRLGKAYKALEHDDIEQFTKLLKKLSGDEIDQAISDQIPCLSVMAIKANHSKALKLIIEHGGSADLTLDADLDLYSLALQQEKSHALLSVLLPKGKQANLEQLIQQSTEICDEQQLMLNLSLLLQHGAELNDSITHFALQSDNLSLINFLFNSGASMPEDIDKQGYSEATIAYARKCEEDLKIRQMFLS